MNLNEKDDGFFSINSIFFIVIASLLTLFSLFYSGWYNSTITGYSGHEGIPPGEGGGGSTGGGLPEPDDPYTNSYVSSNSVPTQVISEVSSVASTISERTSQVVKIDELIKSKPAISEKDLYENLDKIKKFNEDSLKDYDKVSQNFIKYSSNLLDGYHEDIIGDISEINKVINKINVLLSQTVSVRQENQKKEALWILDHQDLVEVSEKYLDVHIEKLKEFKVDDSKLVESGDVCVDGSCSDSKECNPPIYIVSLDHDIVDFGEFGYDYRNREKCIIEDSDVYVRPPNLGRDVDVGVEPDRMPISGIDVIYFNKKGSSGSGGLGRGDRGFTGVVIDRTRGFVTFNFFTSPSYNDLEDKISKFINGVLYGEKNVGENYLTGLSISQVEEIVESQSKIPWLLWAILGLMLFSFLFFERLYIPNSNNLIYLGKKALNKKDYFTAVKNYNLLVQNRLKDFNSRKEITDYFELLCAEIGKNNLHLDFSDKNKLPLIKYNKIIEYSSKASVEKMIHQAIQDLNKNYEYSKKMIPLIIEEYKKLDKGDKKEITPLYEELIYKFREKNKF